MWTTQTTTNSEGFKKKALFCSSSLTDQEGFLETRCIPPECHLEMHATTFLKAFHLQRQPETGRKKIGALSEED